MEQQSPGAIAYDASRRALYSPERSEPPADFSTEWPLDAICAELSRLAYYRFESGDGPRLDATLERAGFAKPATFRFGRTGAEAIGTTLPDGTALVAFRGTQPDSLLDLLADARAKLVDFRPGARVHEGFLGAYQSIAEPIAKWLGGAGGGRLALTGHSLGAAMATVMAAERPDAQLVALGSPRVGDEGFAALFAGRDVRRYVDCTDLVTSVPPELVGYEHVSAERYIDRAGTVHEVPPSPEAIAEDRRLGRRSYLANHAWKVWKNVLFRDLADHAPVNYVSAVLGRRALA